MSENTTATKKSFSFDWLIGGILSKFGDIFDSLTGRRWKPSSSLATSELIERLKKLLDHEVRDLGEKGKFVPHNLKLKMQWDKFSTDSEEALKLLRNELLVAAVDHINDNRYQTYEPLNLEVKPDYFTEGVKLIASFDKIGKEEREVAVNVTVPEIKVGDYLPEPAVDPEPQKEILLAEFFAAGKPRQVRLEFTPGTRRSIGRSKQNDLAIDDISVSKIHATLVLNRENQFQVADTGSTNGTFINDQRISYGKAVTISGDDRIKFGNVEVRFTRHSPAPPQADETVQFSTGAPADRSPAEKTVAQNVYRTDENRPADRMKTVPHSSPDDFPVAEQEANNDNGELTRQDIVFDFEKEKSSAQK